ncbi:hypothetical protein SLEP1_g5032 [Rubroshorea leprosula]|uniref:Uncharacterized protein n=1 Tax=Rubroshorea leprosula TaxID=152421 RepID=A0AAV5HWL7_9ROSI|nr:hypothetical protein SLEP1_g5032 [Rubroshorea leprosula]
MSPPSRQLILRPVSVDKTRPLLYTRSNISTATSSRHGVNRTSKSARFAEVCGAAAAECTAVCCCCPIGIMEFLVLAIYKVPAGLCRRALRSKRRQQLLKNGMLQPQQRRSQCGCDETELHIHSVVCHDELDTLPRSEEADKAVVELEKEMWETFYGAGFWRSASQREPPAIKQP